MNLNIMYEHLSKLEIIVYKSSSGDEIPERDDVHLMITYLLLNYDTPVGLLQNISEVTCTYVMNVDLRKATCISCYYELSVFIA